MPKVTVTFSDSQKMDKEGNPIVDIETVSIPKFPEVEDNFSPAQKTAIKFLSRGGQAPMRELLEALQEESQSIIDALTGDARVDPLPLDIEMARLHALAIKSVIEQNKGSFE